MTLTDFLLARIAEDEAAIRAFPYPPADVERYFAQSMEGPHQDDEYLALHIGAGRMLAECGAKRRIVELHGDDHECSTFGHDGERDNCTWVIGDDCSTMRLLAQPYADHREYREEWKP